MAATACPQGRVGKRLNLITEKVYVELERDRYDAATLSTARDYVALTLRNQTGDAHMTQLTLRGLAPGSYPVMLDGKSADMLTVTDGQPAVLTLSLGGEATYALRVGTRCSSVAPGSLPTGGSAAPGTSPTAGGGGQSNTSSSGTGGATGGSRATGTTGTAGSLATPPGAAGTTGTMTAPITGQPPDAAAPAAKGCSCEIAGARAPRVGWPIRSCESLALLAIACRFRPRRTVPNRRRLRHGPRTRSGR